METQLRMDALKADGWCVDSSHESRYEEADICNQDETCPVAGKPLSHSASRLHVDCPVCGGFIQCG